MLILISDTTVHIIHIIHFFSTVILYYVLRCGEQREYYFPEFP